jgi:hypothetical protein
MSDPRNTDPDRTRRYDVDQTGFWPWLVTAFTILGLLIGGAIGYNWRANHEMRAQSSPPATTGSAPSQQRPAPQTR